MRELTLYAIGASITGTVFLISLLELILTVRRRRVYASLENEIKQVKETYAATLRDTLGKDELKVKEAEEALSSTAAKSQEEQKKLEEKFNAQLADLTAKSQKKLDSAQAKAKKLEQAAKTEAEEYLKSRQKEVEEELMNLVLAVTKKVLPDGLTYETQKELVMHALQQVKSESAEEA